MADGTRLGDFYFDVIFKDAAGNDTMEKELRERLERISRQKLDVEIDTASAQRSIDRLAENLRSIAPKIDTGWIERLSGGVVTFRAKLSPMDSGELQRWREAASRGMTLTPSVSADSLMKMARALEKARMKVDVKPDMETLRNRITEGLSGRKFKIDIAVDRMQISTAVQEALNRVGAGTATAGLTAAQARANRDARSAVIDAERQAAAHARTEAALSRAALAQERLTRYQQGYNSGISRTGGLLTSLTNMARNYVGAFGAVSALKSLYRVRAEFERQEVALTALMQSASKARQVMGELQQMALRSPFSVSQIISFSKQLSAFSIGNDELVETTKRLADLSAGLGVDMSRLILAYGQVKAATVLRGQELRQFTEAGVPMAQALADQFTKLEGRVVSAADVFDRISRKQVSFEMVKKVLDEMTDAGGRFYDHQAKMVETLYGKMQRMGDAWDVMLNNAGKSNDALLKLPVDIITKAMLNWRATLGLIVNVLLAAGVRKLVLWEKSVGSFKESLKKAGKGIKGLFSGANLWSIGAFAIGEAITATMAWQAQLTATRDEIRQLGKDLSAELGEFLRVNSRPFQLIVEGKADTADVEKAWERLREKVNEVDKSGHWMAQLLDIDDLQERAARAVEILNTVKEAAEAVEKTAKKGMATETTWGGVLGEGLADDLKDLTSMMDDYGKYGVKFNFSKSHFVDPLEVKREMRVFAANIAESLKEAIRLHMIDDSEEAAREYVMNIIRGFEAAHPDLDARIKSILELYTMGMVEGYGGKLGDFKLSSESAIAEVTDYFKRAAKASGVDFDALMRRISSGNMAVRDSGIAAFKELFDGALQEARAAGSGIEDYMLSMINRLNEQAITIAVRYTGQASDASNFQREWNKLWNSGSMYSTGENIMDKFMPKQGETEISYGDRMHSERQALSREKARLNAIKKRSKNAEEAARIQESIADITEKEAIYKKLENHYWADVNKNGDYKKPKEPSQRDTWLDRLKGLMSEYNEARQIVEKLRKAGKDEASAVQEALSMPWSEPLEARYLTKGGTEELSKWLLPQLESHLKGLKGTQAEAVRKTIREVRSWNHDEVAKAAEESLKVMGDEIRKRVELTVRNWQLFDRIVEATGDEAMAAMAAFGGKKLFRSLEEQLIAEFNKNGKIDFARAMDMDNASLKEILPNGEAYIDLLRRIKEMRESGWSDLMTKGAAAMKDLMTNEEKIAAKRAEIERLVRDNSVTGPGGLLIIDPAKLAAVNALVEQLKREIADLEGESFKLSGVWREIFDDGSSTWSGLQRRLAAVNKLLGTAVKNGNRWLVTWTEDGKRKSTDISDEHYKSLMDAGIKLENQLKEKNPFKAIKEAATKYKGRERVEQLAAAFCVVSEQGGQALGQMREFFDALGDEDTADALGFASDLLGGLSSVAQGIVSNNPAQAIGGVFQTVVSFFKFHDKKLERVIKRSQLSAKRLENAYSRMEKAIERSMGGIYTADGGNSYNEMLSNLTAQREELIKQREAEQAKKKKDKGAIEDYNKQISELDDTIKHFAEDTANTLYGIDIKSWAKDLTDAVVGAWQSGGNAVEAYRDKVRDIMADLTKNILSQRVMEAALQPVLDSVIAEMTATGGKLTEGSLTRFAQELGAAGEGAVNVITGIMEQLKAQGYDLTTSAGNGTIGQGIQSITEDQADLLDSYVNAMRADLSAVRMLWERFTLERGAVADAQVQQLEAIAASTLRNAEAAERIEAALGSVIAIGAGGSRIRV